MDKLTGSLMRLAAAFPLDRVPESTITLYRSKLAQLDADLMATVIESAIDTASRFPTIAELRESYRTALQRMPVQDEALPVGRTPMPEEIKKQIQELTDKFDERAKQMEEA